MTKNFSDSEFDCKDGTPYPLEWKASRLVPLQEALEKIRAKCGGYPILISSGYRTPTHNKKVGGGARSLHVEGIAADLMCREIHPQFIKAVIEQLISEDEIPDGGVGVYEWGVHYDIRTILGMGRARW